MSGIGRRFWQVYNVVVVIFILGLGVLTMIGGSTRDLVLGAALLLGGVYLASRTGMAARRRSGAPQLSDVQIDRDGIEVLSGAVETPSRARIVWADCVAIVASPAAAGGPGLYYVHFMPASEAAVRLDGQVPASVLRTKATVADLPLSPAVAMVWLCAAETLPRAFGLLENIRTLRPEIRIIDSIRRPADDS
ncbi:hypothetical protein BH11ACT8_BH11ACT8_33340 [soil metagenome]